MSDEKMAELRKLSDTAQTVAGRDDDIRGRDVKDQDGNDLGKVDDLLMDPQENKVRFLVLASGDSWVSERRTPLSPLTPSHESPLTRSIWTKTGPPGGSACL